MSVPQTEIILRHAGTELARTTLPPGEYVIGRDPTAGIRADTPLLSRKHALLTLREDALLIEDLGSSNGTYIEQQPVAGTALIFPGQDLRLGDVTLEVIRAESMTGPTMNMAWAMADATPQLPPEVLSAQRYAIGEQVARGGMGAILEAQQNAMGRRVAMKVMLEASDAGDIARFVDEAKITGQLEHPNIVPVHELGVDEQGQLFYTMKFVRGITLKKVLDLLAQGVEGTAKKYPLPTLLTIFQKACDAIAFAHSHEVIHRDLKPENIMLGDFGEVLVMDWGLAKVIGTGEHAITSTRGMRSASPGASSHTMAGTVMGTPQYMAPEQARGEVDTMDARADIYSLGAILFEILHLRAPLTGTDAWEIVEKVRRGAIDWTTPKKPAPDSLLAIYRKALALDRAQRYAHVEQLQADLTAYQNGFATSAEKAGLAKQLWLALKRHKTAATATALVLLAGLGFGGKAVIEGRRAERALTALKATAPDLLRLAASDANQQNFPAAHKNVDAALALDPALTAAYWQRAWNFIGQEDYAAGVEALRAAQKIDPSNPQRLRLIASFERMAKAPTPEERYDHGDIGIVFSQLRDAGATGPASVILSHLKNNNKERQGLLIQRLTTLIGKQNFSTTITPTGFLQLTVSPGAVGNFEILRGLSFDMLHVSFARAKNLEPLRGMRLLKLALDNSIFEDLSPLAGMPIFELDIAATPVIDLAPLAGMPLRSLRATATRIADLEPLRGAPLDTLSLIGTPVGDCSPLTGAPLHLVELGSTRIRNLDFLAKSPVQTVHAAACQFLADISGLRGTPVTVLTLSKTAVTDLSPLRGSGVKVLVLDHAKKITDFTPILDLTQLDRLSIVGLPQALPVARQHPRIKLINYQFPGEPAPIERPAVEFWELYDAQPQPAK